MEVRYKIYEMIKSIVNETDTYILEECTINYGIGFDTFEDAVTMLKNNGNDCVEYTILPYIFMTYY